MKVAIAFNHWTAVHFAGYEFARCGVMALFTSDRIGFSQASMVTLATALVSPFSLVVLWVGTVAQRTSLVGYYSYTVVSIKKLSFGHFLATGPPKNFRACGRASCFAIQHHSLRAFPWFHECISTIERSKGRVKWY